MKKYPFKFLNSYDQNDTDIFFGRDEEIAALYEMVFQTSIILVYGASGTGKTSLIQCGLAGKFNSYDWLPLLIRRGSNINVSLKKQLTDAGGNYLDEEDTTKANTPVKLTSLLRLIKGVYLNNFKPLYLVFDQFEELFVLGNNAEMEQFIKTVKEILRAQQPVKMIFSIREEYLGYLYEFEKEVPQLLRKKLRIEPMSLNKVTSVIEGINNYRLSNVKVKNEEIGSITQEIFERIKGEKKTLTIQLPYLQVFLDNVYIKATHDETRQADALITMDVLKSMGDIGDVLRNFLEEQVSKISLQLSTATNAISSDIVWKILSPFSTLEGTKEPISKKELTEKLAGINTKTINAAVEAFVTKRIVNYAENENLYELAHDSLALCVAEKRSDEERAILEVQRLIKSQVLVKEEVREHFTEKQLIFIKPYLKKIKLNNDEKDLIKDSKKHIIEQKRRAKIKRQEELAKTKKRLRILYSILTAAILALISAGYFGITATKAKKEAVSQKNSTQQALNSIKEFLETSVGKKYGGGIVFYSDSTGKHGLIAAEKDIPGRYSWDSAIQKCKDYSIIVNDTTYNDWRLPTVQELVKIYANKEKFSGFSSYKYWSSSSYDSSDAEAMEINFDNGYGYHNNKVKNLYNVRPVRKF